MNPCSKVCLAFIACQAMTLSKADGLDGTRVMNSNVTVLQGSSHDMHAQRRLVELDYEDALEKSQSLYVPYLEFASQIAAKLVRGENVTIEEFYTMYTGTLDRVLEGIPDLVDEFVSAHPLGFVISKIAGTFFKEMLLPKKPDILEEVLKILDQKFLFERMKDAANSVDTVITGISEIVQDKMYEPNSYVRDKDILDLAYIGQRGRIIESQKLVWHEDCIIAYQRNTQPSRACTQWRQHGTFELARVWIPFHLHILLEKVRLSDQVSNGQRQREKFVEDVLEQSQMEAELLRLSFREWKSKHLSQRLVDPIWREKFSLDGETLLPWWNCFWSRWMMTKAQDCALVQDDWAWWKEDLKCSVDLAMGFRNGCADGSYTCYETCTGACDRVPSCGIDASRRVDAPATDNYLYCTDDAEKSMIDQCWKDYKASVSRDLDSKFEVDKAAAFARVLQDTWKTRPGQPQCSYTLLDNSQYCSGGYYRGNCDGGHRERCNAEDLAAAASLDACQQQCNVEEECHFIAFANNICSRYNSGAGDCSVRRGGGHKTMQKNCGAVKLAPLQISGSAAGNWNGRNHDYRKAWDGDTDTHMEQNWQGGVVITEVDLGVATGLTKIRFHPRKTHYTDVVGAKFEGRSGSSSSWQTIATVVQQIPGWNELQVSGTYRYVRYYVDDKHGYTAMAEIELYGYPVAGDGRRLASQSSTRRAGFLV